VSQDDDDDDIHLRFEGDEEWDSCWVVLDIGETNDKKVIRRAYADKLREMGRGRKADAFQRLRSAYEAALSEADWLDDADEWEADEPEDHHTVPKDSEGAGATDQTHPSDDIEDTGKVDRAEGADDDALADDGTVGGDEEEESAGDWDYDDDGEVDESPAGLLATQAEDVFNDPSKCYSFSSWMELLNESRFVNIDDRKDAGDRLFWFFWDQVSDDRKAAEKLKTIPPTVWLQIDKLFAWSEGELVFAQIYGDEGVDTIMHQVHKAHGCRIVDSGHDRVDANSTSGGSENRDEPVGSAVARWFRGVLIWMGCIGLIRLIISFFED
jgi:hypothetical protein